MKKILWVCNTPLPEIQNLVGIKNYNEGWLVGISEQLRKQEDIVFYYAFPQNKRKRNICKTINGIHFFGFYRKKNNPYEIDKTNIKTFHDMIKTIEPDIIHIFGTELPHALECVNSISDKSRIIVSLQGLTSEIAKVYLDGIPFYYRLSGVLNEGKYKCLLMEQNEFYKRGINEQKILLNVENVIGRTDWDKKCVKKINPQCHYYYCGETLRSTFYDGTWNINAIQRHSLFISQAYYPIKGLHILISALPLIKKRFSDVKVYIAGNREFIEKKTPYGKYILRLIRKYQVAEQVVFLGYLTAEKLKERLLKTHIMVMPSLIENSPNSIGEAMLLGTPVVAANVGGIPSILHDKKDGILYSATDRNELAKRICTIFRNDNLAIRFSDNAKKFAGNLYNRTDNADRLLTIYDAMMNLK